MSAKTKKQIRIEFYASALAMLLTSLVAVLLMIGISKTGSDLHYNIPLMVAAGWLVLFSCACFLFGTSDDHVPSRLFVQFVLWGTIFGITRLHAQYDFQEKGWFATGVLSAITIPCTVYIFAYFLNPNSKG